MAMQSLHRFVSLKALLDFRKAFAYDMDCYIYCKGFPEGFAINGYIPGNNTAALLFGAKHTHLDAISFEGGSAAYLLVASGLPVSSRQGGGTNPFISLSTAQWACLETVIGEVLAGHREKQSGHFLLFLEHLLNQREPALISGIEHYGRRIGIAYRFIAVVEQQVTKHHDVSHYAGLLCVSSGYLSKCVNFALNMSAKKFITSVLMERAEKLLRDTDGTIVEISDLLGFDISNSFTAFFKQNRGITPSSFRRLKL